MLHKEPMNIFRTILDTDLGEFLVDAIHNDSKVQLMSVRQIDEDGIVGHCIPIHQEMLVELKQKIEKVLSE